MEPIDEKTLSDLLDSHARESELTGDLSDDRKKLDEFANDLYPEAKEALEACLNSEKDSVKLSAAKFVFQLKFGKELTEGSPSGIEKLLDELRKND